MQKIFPIRVEKATVPGYNFIEWKIHNVCNYNCGFCGNRHKDGSQRWLSLDEYKSYIDKLLLISNGKPLWIQLTGGEPTLFPELLELMIYIKSKGIMLSMVSNGSRTLRWWRELQEAKVLDQLLITYHSHQTTNFQHVTEVLNVFSNDPLETVCLITHEISSIDTAFEAYDYILENTDCFIIIKAMMIGSYDIYSMYTPEQYEKIKSATLKVGKKRKLPFKLKTNLPPELLLIQTLKITYNDDSSKIVDPQDLMKTKENVFMGWDCDIGQTTMRIDYTTVYRGVCEQGASTELSDPNLNFTNDFVKCESRDCFCGTDMVATKILPKELYPQS